MVSEHSSIDGSGVSWPIILAITCSRVADIVALAPLVMGLVELSHVAGLNVCSDPAAAAVSRLLNEVTYFLCGSSEAMMGLSLKFSPDPLGVQRSAEGPCAVLYMIAP